MNYTPHTQQEIDRMCGTLGIRTTEDLRSEEHTSELQSQR